MKILVFALFLRQLILRDYRLRERGQRSDRLHWADAVAVRWGFFV